MNFLRKIIPKVVTLNASIKAEKRYKFLFSEFPIPAAPRVKAADPGVMNKNV